LLAQKIFGVISQKIVVILVIKKFRRFSSFHFPTSGQLRVAAKGAVQKTSLIYKKNFPLAKIVDLIDRGEGIIFLNKYFKNIFRK